MLMEEITREQLINDWEALYETIYESPMDISEFIRLFKRTWKYFSDLAKNDSIVLEDLGLVNQLNSFQMQIYGCECTPMDIAEKHGLSYEYFTCEWFISKLLENIPNKEFASGELIIKEWGVTTIIFMDGFEKAFYEEVETYSKMIQTEKEDL